MSPGPAAGLHLAALWALAVAQPLFDLLGESAEFFAVRDTTGVDIVLFAVGLVLLPPALILLVERLADLVSGRLARGLHLAAVAGLTGLLALQVAVRATDLSASILVPTAALVGGAGALAYAGVAPVRTILTVLAPVPLLFLGLFLFGSPVRDLLLVREPEPRIVAVRSDTPVVLVIFDEVSTTSLLDEAGGIDAVRYPAFAALARGSTWFRNAATVNAYTTNAVPAILTGAYPERGTLPIFSEHPDNLFTLLGSRYSLHVSESLTQLCPRALCPPTARRSFPRRMQALLEDAGLVYLHVALPDELRERLPSVSDSWGAFLESSHERTRRRLSLFEDFTASLDGEHDRTLAFAHFMLPHPPWEFLPSGRRYEGGDLPGFDVNHWASDSFLVEQGYQRYLLQLGFADRLLGNLVVRLRSVGLYDRALLVVVADHGVSFRPGDRRRAFSQTNLDDVAFVPLIVKRPGQQEGEVVDDPVQTVDILPTIAETLGVQVPWHVDGLPLFGERRRDRFVLLADRAIFRVDPTRLLARRDASLERQVALFGAGADEPGLFGIGPHRGLLGRRIAELEVAAGGRARAELDQAAALRSVDLGADEIPARLTGTISAEGAAGRPLAVALGEEIVAVARSYSFAGEERFSVLVPEDALVDGPNHVGVFWVRSAGELVRLQ